MSVDFAFLDSGTGGIPYMLLLKKKMPEAKCVYLGDTAHFPYGEKSASEVTECAASSINALIAKCNPRAIIIACNTISVTSLDELRAMVSVPIVGTVPAIRLAAQVTQNKKIGLLATNATVRHPYCKKLIDLYASDCEVYNRGDPELVAFIERNLFTASRAERLEAVEPACAFFSDCGCDTIILGCTHYTHLASEIEEVFAKKSGRKIFVVDSREGVSKQALKVIAEIGQIEKIGTKAQIGDIVPNDTEAPSNPAAQPLAEAAIQDTTFFVTALKSENDRKEYHALCDNYGIPFGGILH